MSINEWKPRKQKPRYKLVKAKVPLEHISLYPEIRSVLTPEQQARARAIYAQLRRFPGLLSKGAQTEQDFVTGFGYDLNPGREIGLWEDLARRLNNIKSGNDKRAKEVMTRWLEDCPRIVLFPKSSKGAEQE
jgi:hypothetical protein